MTQLTQNTDTELIKETIKKFLKLDITKQELINIMQEIEQDELPIELLTIKKLSNIEAIVKYLRENQQLSYKKIGEKLNRKPMTLAVSYKKAKEKMPEKIIITKKETIPFQSFNNELSILESIIIYLQKQGLKQIQISKLTQKNPRTVWTTIQRANEKINSAKT